MHTLIHSISGARQGTNISVPSSPSSRPHCPAQSSISGPSLPLPTLAGQGTLQLVWGWPGSWWRARGFRLLGPFPRGAPSEPHRSCRCCSREGRQAAHPVAWGQGVGLALHAPSPAVFLTGSPPPPAFRASTAEKLPCLGPQPCAHTRAHGWSWMWREPWACPSARWPLGAAAGCSRGPYPWLPLLAQPGRPELHPWSGPKDPLGGSTPLWAPEGISGS